MALSGIQDEKGTGVWCGQHKIASIGIAFRRWVSYHGLALNISTDLEAFAKIHPCGFSSDVMANIDHKDLAVQDAAEGFKNVLIN